MSASLPFYGRCVEWPMDDIDVLNHLCENERQISRKTFLRHVDPLVMSRLEKRLGYEKGVLEMKNDYHVSYHKCGEIYFFRWSAIEFVFATPAQIEEVRRKLAAVV